MTTAAAITCEICGYPGGWTSILVCWCRRKVCRGCIDAHQESCVPTKYQEQDEDGDRA